MPHLILFTSIDQCMVALKIDNVGFFISIVKILFGRSVTNFGLVEWRVLDEQSLTY